jgi:hypothetical protein
MNSSQGSAVAAAGPALNALVDRSGATRRSGPRPSVPAPLAVNWTAITYRRLSIEKRRSFVPVWPKYTGFYENVEN